MSHEFLRMAVSKVLSDGDKDAAIARLEAERDALIDSMTEAQMAESEAYRQLATLKARVEGAKAILKAADTSSKLRGVVFDALRALEGSE